MGKVNIAKIFGSDVKDIMRLLNSSGKDCYIVGGAVRDLLLQHKELSDIDLTTPLRVEQLKQIFDINQIKVNDRALKYGSLTIRTQKRSLQITSFRKDIQTFGRSADVAHIENIEEDAKRRDFTINAFYCSYNGEIIDPLGNLKDLNKKKLKFIGDPEKRITEDYLRILRFFRFVAVLDLKNKNIGSNYLPIIKKHLHGLNELSDERVAIEIRKILLAVSPSYALGLMNAAGLYEKFLGVYSQKSLLKIERLERRFELKPDLVRRLLALEIQNPYPLMSKREKKCFKDMSALIDFEHNSDYLGYKVGEKSSLDFLIIKAVKNGISIKTKDIQRIKKASKRTFPIKFSDVQTLTKDLNATKENIDLMEDFWIRSGFKASKGKLLGLIN
jgi:tRNA nucleotidyltransferase/poly(A) polymerase|tara:strand:- start:1289 stop:2449 length:1161 start_codon:yes stop_codon:yes gene_type:complete